MSYEAWGEPPELPCEVCGAYGDRCVCDECPVCGEYGQPKCYVEHGMTISDEQIAEAHRHEPPDYDPGEWHDP